MNAAAPAHTISVVIPVYQGERTLRGVLAEIAPHFETRRSAAGHDYVVTEVILVNDRAVDDSARVMRELAEEIPQVRPVWLSRNFGQHAATLAGMASSGGDWVVTLDEDGQHDPTYIPDLLDTAMREQAQVVYAKPTNAPPHGMLRNAASVGAKMVVRRWMKDTDATSFQSYRLILGEVARSVAAYSGTGIYLDVALSWVAGHTAQCPVLLRAEDQRASGYSARRLLGHFWRLVLSSGTRGLRLVSILGVSFALLGVVLVIYVAVATLSGGRTEPGWASLIIVLCLGVGATLFSLGVVAEYVGVAVNMAMGKPLYLITSDPANGPLARPAAGSADAG